MDIPEELFHIDKDHLNEKKIFPFHLYIYNPRSHQYSSFLFGNSPLIREKEDLLDFILERGGAIAVDMRQKNTFLRNQDYDEDQIPSLNHEVHELEKVRQKKLENLKENPDDELARSFAFKDEFSSAVDNDNFWPIIERAKKEIELFSVRISHTTSLAVYLSQKLFTQDNYTNRVVACSYFLAKNLDLKDEESLGDLVVASFFAHIGYTQLDYSLGRFGYIELTDSSKKSYKQHAGLSHHLIKKSGIELSDRCINIIKDHHERADGQGYPAQKSGEVLDQLSLILGAVSHLFEFHTGKINGSITPIKSVIHYFKNKSIIPGLEFEFGDRILENLITILTVEQQNKNVA